MDQKDLIKQFKERDRVVRALSKDGLFRVSSVKNTTAAKTAQQKHNLPPVPALLLARQMTAASMMASFLKGEERISIEMEGPGPVSKVVTEALQVGEVRGYVNYNNIDNISFENIGEAVGVGLLKVIRILYNQTEPIIGVIPLQKGDVSSDITYYFMRSEQIPSALILDVDFDDKGIINHSGGLLVQAMPGASDKDLEDLYRSLSEAGPYTDYLSKGMLPNEIIKEILHFDVDILKSSPLDFYCRCSKDAFMGKLLTLGYDEIAGMEKDGNTNLNCQYCNTNYTLGKDDFDRLKEELTAVKN